MADQDQKEFRDKILRIAKNLMVIVHNLGRFASYDDVRRSFLNVCPDINEQIAEFASEDTEPLLGFLQTLSCTFSVITIDNETYVSLFREYNGLYTRFGYAVMETQDETIEKYLAKSDGTKFVSLPKFTNCSEYNFAKVTLTIFFMIRTLAKAFKKDRMALQRLHYYCKEKFTHFAVKVLDFCRTSDDQTGFIKFLFFFDKIFTVERQSSAEQSVFVHFNRHIYKFLGKVIELDVITSYLGMYTFFESSILNLVSELREFLKNLKIAMSVNEGIVTALLSRRADILLLGNGTVHYLPLYLGKIPDVEVSFAQEFFYEYVKKKVIEYDKCIEILTREVNHLKDVLKGMNALHIASSLYLRSDWFTFINGSIHPAPFPPKHYIYIVFEIVAVEAPTYMELDYKPIFPPTYFKAKGIMTDVGVYTAIIGCQEILDPTNKYSFQNNCFCDTSITLISDCLVSDFSTVLIIGDVVEFLFSYNENRTVDRPLLCTALNLFIVKKLYPDTNSCVESVSSDYDDEPRVPPINPCDFPIPAEHTCHPTSRVKRSKTSARQRYIERTIKNPKERKERLRKYGLFEGTGEAGNSSASQISSSLPIAPESTDESDRSSPNSKTSQNRVHATEEIGPKHSVSAEGTPRKKKKKRKKASAPMTEKLETEARNKAEIHKESSKDQSEYSDCSSAQNIEIDRLLCEQLQKMQTVDFRMQAIKPSVLSNKNEAQSLPVSTEKSTLGPLSESFQVKPSLVSEPFHTGKVTATGKLTSNLPLKSTDAVYHEQSKTLYPELSAHVYIPDEKTGARPKVRNTSKKQSIKPATTESLSPKGQKSPNLRPDKSRPTELKSSKERKST